MSYLIGAFMKEFKYNGWIIHDARELEMLDAYLLWLKKIDRLILS